MQTFLMKKTERQQFELLKQLIRKPEGMTALKITDYLHISLHAAYRYEKQLSDGLSQTFPENKVLLFKENNIYKIFIDRSLSISYVIDTMGLYYIQISQQFGLSRALLHKNFPSAEALAQEVNLSLSHTYKILKRMNKSFEPFNISIVFSEGDINKNMVGDEKSIRITMFYIYWAIYKGLEWPFFRSPKYFSELPAPIKITQLSPSQKKRLIYFQTFTYWQIIYKKSYVILQPEFTAYLDFFEEVSPVHFPETIQDLLYKNQVPESVIRDEERYFGFLARFYIANIDSSEDKQLIVAKLKRSKLPLTDFAMLFLDQFI
ncbi:helix-turn-helix domain-containing protein [Enterococcus sp. AZ192]|uniref:helix-turn-helix domain-containing protein n=1 Tax=unclassified Enterococcus TaxID=2608891 RepID=UPI003D2C7F40